MDSSWYHEADEYLADEVDRCRDRWVIAKRNSMAYPIWSKMRWYWWGIARRYWKEYKQAYRTWLNV